MRLASYVSLLFLLLCSLSPQAWARVIRKTVKMPNTNAWIPLGRAVVVHGKVGTVNITARLTYPYHKRSIRHFKTNEELPEANIQIGYVQDDEWERFSDELDCNRRQETYRFHGRFQVPLDGNWSRGYQIGFDAPVRTKIWYVVIEDCLDNVLHQFNRDLPKLELRAVILNDHSHFQQEDAWMVELHFFALVVFVAFLGSSLFGYYQLNKRVESQDAPVILLVTAILFELLEIIFKLIHYSAYAYDGEGLVVMDVFSVIAQVTSQFLMVTLLLLISSGWTINFDTLPDKDLYVPIGGLVLVVHLMIGGLTFVDNDDVDKHHYFAGVQGLILVMLRLGMFGLFQFWL